MKIDTKPSSNCNARADGIALQYVVLHYTGLPTAQEALSRLCDPSSQVSAHYMIDEDGSLTQLVDESSRAWHAGQSFWRGERDLNSASLGIELVNPGHEYGYRPFPREQIAALKDLLRDIMRRYHLPASCLLAHSDIAPLRKQDPGEYFPWQELAAEGIGLWPAPEKQDYLPTSPDAAARLLNAIGYDCPEQGLSNVFRSKLELSKCHGDERLALAALIAFERRYHPENLDSEPNAETFSRLSALARMMGT